MDERLKVTEQVQDKQHHSHSSEQYLKQPMIKMATSKELKDTAQPTVYMMCSFSKKSLWEHSKRKRQIGYIVVFYRVILISIGSAYLSDFMRCFLRPPPQPPAHLICVSKNNYQETYSEPCKIQLYLASFLAWCQEPQTFRVVYPGSVLQREPGSIDIALTVCIAYEKRHMNTGQVLSSVNLSIQQPFYKRVCIILDTPVYSGA